MCLQFFEDPTDPMRTVLVTEFESAKHRIDTLMETGWIKIKGRRKTPGQPLTYGTTDAFLEHFGLESLGTLPGKADLEAEGLLSDVIPAGFQMVPGHRQEGQEGHLGSG